MLEDLINCLETWNLKYDEFPEVLRMDNVVLVGMPSGYVHELKFDYLQEAVEAEKDLNAAMKRRADNYWGVV